VNGFVHGMDSFEWKFLKVIVLLNARDLVEDLTMSCCDRVKTANFPCKARTIITNHQPQHLMNNSTLLRLPTNLHENSSSYPGIKSFPLCKSRRTRMCKETTTTYTLCPCRVPSVDCCPRCPTTGYNQCVDFSTEEEEQKGVCVGLGTCPAEVEVKSTEEGKGEGKEGKEGKEEGPGLGAIDWGEVFGLVGSCGD
jgi:hypothetical protein